MKYSIDKEDNYALMRLDEKYLNNVIAPKLKSEFIFIRNENVKNLILDLSQVEYIDSSGLSAILTANRLWAEDGSFILLDTYNETIAKILDISKLNTVLTIIPTLEESLDFIMLENIEDQLMQIMEEE